MSATSALRSEIESAYVQDRQLMHIRVTTDAIPGAPSALPITPERLRGMGGPEGAVAVHSNVSPLEIVVHPEDWADALRELPTLGADHTLTSFHGHKVIR